MRPFPEGFLFGCATSAYQVEGDIENDWARWAREGRLKDPNARCGAASDHWNRYEEDFDLLKEIGAKAYRMSIEWARVEPSPGEYDEQAIDRYARMISALSARGIEPFVTFLHFTHPPWFHEVCPWHRLDKDAPERFARFCEKVLEAIGDQVRFYTVLNEPNVWLSAAYFAGKVPPGQKKIQHLGQAAAGLLKAHGLAYRAIKRIASEDAQVGIAHNVIRFEPANPKKLLDRTAANYVSYHYNHAIIKGLVSGKLQFGLLPKLRLVHQVPEAEGTLDFIGINYYTRVFIDARVFPKPGAEFFYEDRGGLGVSDLGWELHPSALTDILEEWNNRYGLPMYITENGIDDRDDSRRAGFIHDHLQAVLYAIARGVDIRGYLHWSLIDNFEWLEGFEPRFGLARVDYEDMSRKLNDSARYYAQVIREGALPKERPAFKKKPGHGRTPVG